MTALLGTNVILRHLLADHDEHSPRATALVAAIEAGEQRAILAEPVVFEVVFMLERRYGRSKAQASDALGGLLAQPGLVIENKERLLRALDVHVQRNISIVDAYVAALALESDGEVISFDRDFDRIPGVTRVEP